jgi:hypothetical protein
LTAASISARQGDDLLRHIGESVASLIESSKINQLSSRSIPQKRPSVNALITHRDPSMLRFLCVALALIAVVVALFVERLQAADDKPTPDQVFEKRVVPIFKSPNPSSCTQCHLSGVDLKNYILPSSEKTFLSLRDQGLIDLKKPEDSKILRLINMSEADKGGANLIHEKIRKAEYEAFAEWIKICANDPKLRDAPKLGAQNLGKPEKAIEVIRHSRKDHLLERFEQTVWSMRFRCMSCHIEGSPENEKFQKEHGPRVAWIKKDGSEATMNYLIHETKLIDATTPEKSLLLLKPLLEVKHGGGKKFLLGDQGYKAFRAWIEDYVATKNGTYTTADDLPKPATKLVQFGSDIWLKLAETPPEWGDKLLQVTVYAWDEGKKTWATASIASSDRGVWGKGKLWQHTLTLATAKDSELARKWKAGKALLPPGKYLVKVYVDTKDRLAKDWKATLDDDDYAGQLEFQARWAEGYGQMTVLDARRVKK